jgi:hypothetical protein
VDDDFGGGGASIPPPPTQTSTTDVGRERYRQEYEAWAAKARARRGKKPEKNVLGPVSTPLGTAAETRAREL